MAEKDYKNVMHLGNPTNTIAVLNRYGFSFQKKFGQNFLIDENVVEKIVRDAGVTKDFGSRMFLVLNFNFRL